MDALDPTERAVFLLHDVFGYPFDEVADAVGRSAAACRQIASRSAPAAGSERVELWRADEAHERDMVARMSTAMLGGDIPGLMDLLSPDVVQLDDGGPQSSRRSTTDRRAAPRGAADGQPRKRMPVGSEVEFVRVNGNPGVLLRIDGTPDLVLTMEFGPDGRIRRLWSQLNPDKLASPALTSSTSVGSASSSTPSAPTS